MSALLLAAAKADLNITATASDTKLQATIDAAESMISAKVGPLAATTVTRRVLITGYTLVLPVVPAASLISVTYVGGAALTLSDLYLDIYTGTVIYNQQGRPFAPGWHTVVYTAGWAALPDGIPEGLLEADKELVRYLWRPQRGSGASRPGSSPSESINVAAARTRPDAAFTFPVRVEQALRPYLVAVA